MNSIYANPNTILVA